jgi:hypothetical protein
MSVTAWVVLSLVADLFVHSALIECNNAVETTRVFKTKLAGRMTFLLSRADRRVGRGVS